MKKAVILLTILVCCSCGSTKVATQLVRESSVDTVYLSNVRYDSIYVYQSHDREYRPAVGTFESDTVFVKDESVEYRYKFLKDTVRIVQQDSIPYQVTIVETREIARPLSWFDHMARTCFWMLLAVLGYCLIRLFRRIRVPKL